MHTLELAGAALVGLGVIYVVIKKYFYGKD